MPNYAEMGLNEQELLNDLLNQEKQIIGVYSTGITESSCTNMRQVLTSNMTQTCQDQYNVFNEMKAKGYYQTKDAADADVTTAKQKFTQVRSGLS